MICSWRRAKCFQSCATRAKWTAKACCGQGGLARAHPNVMRTVQAPVEGAYCTTSTDRVSNAFRRNATTKPATGWP